MRRISNSASAFLKIRLNPSNQCHPCSIMLNSYKICNYSAFSRKVSDCPVISTNGRNLERWHMTRGLRFLAALGMTRGTE